MRLVLALSLILTAVPAMAQTVSPLSGPNDSIPSPVCDIINFGFCPQPAPPPPNFPDPDLDAATAPPAPPPMHHHKPHRHRRHVEG